MHIEIQIYMHIHIHVFIPIQLHIHSNMDIYIYTYICIHAFFHNIHLYLYSNLHIYIYIYIHLPVLRSNVDLPQVKIKPFCLILVDANLIILSAWMFSFQRKSFSEMVDSLVNLQHKLSDAQALQQQAFCNCHGCCMVSLTCISFRDILLFWILETVGIQIDIFL